MASCLYKVHAVGMSENGGTYLTVDAFYDDDNKKVKIKPPIQVVFEGEEARVAVTQDALAARYHDDELREIGDGSSILGLKRVIGDIATKGGLVYGDIKPLHPNLFEGQEVAQAELVAPPRELTA